MKKFLLALVLFLLPTVAFAQCNGVFSAHTVCGNPGATPAVPGQVPVSVITGSPAGATGSIQYNNGGVFGGFILGGDCTVTTATGIEICTKTNGVAFAASATSDTTNAANIISGNLSVNRLNAGSGATTSTFWRGDGTWAAPAASGGIPGVINVQAAPYNAACNGSTDDTTAIQSAITAALAVNGGTTVQFPNANCKTTGTLNVGAFTASVCACKIILQGTGWGSQITYTGTGTAIAVSGVNPNTFEMNNLQIIQSNAASTGMTWTNANISRCIFCRITGGKNNLVIATSFATAIEHSLFGGTTNEAVIYGVSGNPGTDASCNASNFNFNGVYSTSGSVNSGAVTVHGACESFTAIGNDIETGYIGMLLDSGIRVVTLHGDYFESMTAAPVFFQTGVSYVDIVGNSWIMHTNPGVTLAGDHIHFDNNVINDFTVSFASVSFLELGNNLLLAGSTITNALWNSFTPSLACGSATFSVTSAQYQKIGNTTYLTLDATITALGTCTTSLGFTLPTTPQGGAALSGRELTISGDSITCGVSGSSTAMACGLAGTNVAWGVNDHILVGGTYQSAP